ncbi:MAG: xanthine dehydrogenase small subunit [Pseudomonadota bacterium]
MSTGIRFVLNGEIVTLDDVEPTRTVLQYLREDRGLTGTKEGCAEGDCGACTAVVVELAGDGERLRYRAINACIQFLPTLHGRGLLTVEALTDAGAPLHPVQQSMVDCHGSQCGFCTPGFVMSLFALYKSAPRPSRYEVDVALAGNLCRCTGYRPIVAAATAMYDSAGDGPDEAALADSLRSLQPLDAVAAGEGTHSYFAPVALEHLAQLVEEHPEATLLAGGTDVGLWVTKQYRDLGTVIHVGGVAELQRIDDGDDGLVVGAAVTLTDAIPAIVAHYPDLEDMFVRFASPPIRNAATLGGNIANGSPIGDAMPALIALGTRLTLRRGTNTRELLLEDLYLDYQKTVLAPGEFVERIHIPRPCAGQIVRNYKLSKRFDQDISAVCAAFSLCLDGDGVGEIRIAYGGMAATPKRAPQAEAALSGEPWTEASVRDGMAALAGDYTPLTDMRASAAYRRDAAANLLYRFFLDSSNSGIETDVYRYGR